MRYLSLIIILITLVGCQKSAQQKAPETTPNVKPHKIPVIFDTDANNELDDQHALAYLLFSGDVFDVRGITVNATYNGGDIAEHMAEATRVMKLSMADANIPLKAGANADFEDVRTSIDDADFDGIQAVNFIIEEARLPRDQKLVLLPVGKLTNIALALEKAPDIKNKVRIVWLGSNYPEPGEYNQDNDEPSMNYILDQEVPFEIVTVRYGKPTGSDVVKVTPMDMEQNMSGIGPTVDPVEGRHGGTFTDFGSYSIDLFSHIDLHGDPPSRSLFDMVAVAILKNNKWATLTAIPAPTLVEGRWEERPENQRKICLWENFKKDEILKDFFSVMNDPVFAQRE